MPIDDLLRRAIDLNLRYYASVGLLTADYLRDLAEVVASSSSMRPFAHPQSPRTSHPQSSRAASPQSTPDPAGNTGPMMVFDAEAGQPAIGVFMVENHLPHDVGATIAVSKLADPSGNVLDLQQGVKISRAEVRGILLRSALFYPMPRMWQKLFSARGKAVASRGKLA